MILMILIGSGEKVTIHAAGCTGRPCSCSWNQQGTMYDISKGVVTMNLFKRGNFVLHSGEFSPFKIDCDALTYEDWETLAAMIVEAAPPFGVVEGVPTGGLKLAEALQMWTMPPASADYPLLIVDDVATTWGSMEEHRAGRNALGFVVFDRIPLNRPAWGNALFTLDWRVDTL